MMSKFVGNYYLETGHNFDINIATVTEVIGIDEFGRLIFGACVFCGTWSECHRYAKSH